MHRYIGIIVVAVVLCESQSANGDELRVEMKGHGPCNSDSGPAQSALKLRFPSYKNSVTRRNPESNCFAVSNGTTEVLNGGIDDLRKYHIYTTMRFNQPDAPYETCTNANPTTNCGGVGSCFYCDPCNNVDLAQRVRIMQGDRPFDCLSAWSVPQGLYQDNRLVACLPTRTEMLKLINDNPADACKTWQIFMKRASDKSQAGLPVYMRVFVYDRPVAQIAAKNLAAFQKNYVDADGPKTNMVACHWLLVHVYDDNPQTVDGCLS